MFYDIPNAFLKVKNILGYVMYVRLGYVESFKIKVCLSSIVLVLIKHSELESYQSWKKVFGIFCLQLYNN